MWICVALELNQPSYQKDQKTLNLALSWTRVDREIEN